jgi:hypothetical protein
LHFLRSRGSLSFLFRLLLGLGTLLQVFKQAAERAFVPRMTIGVDEGSCENST